MERMLLAAALTVASTFAWAGPGAGELDPTFGESYAGVLGVTVRGFNQGGTWNDYARSMSKDAQGRLYLVGTADVDVGDHCLALLRTSANGIPDKSFGSNGRICHKALFADGISLSVGISSTVQEDGKLLVSGIRSASRMAVCRFLQDGKVDTGFGDNANKGCITLPTIIAAGEVTPNVFQRGNSIYVVSNDVSSGGDALQPVLTKLALSNGAIQFYGSSAFARFMPAEWVGGSLAYSASLTTAGHLLVAGYADNPNNGASGGMVASMDPVEGVIDPAFGVGGVLQIAFDPDFSAATAISSAADGTASVAGVIEGAQNGIFVARISATSGVLLPTFNAATPVTFALCESPDCVSKPVAIERTGQGALTIAGTLDADADPATDKMYAMRVLPSGALDLAFGNAVDGPGMATVDLEGGDDVVAGMVLQGERVVLGGYTDTGNDGIGDEFVLARLGDGSIFRDGFEIAP